MGRELRRKQAKKEGRSLEKVDLKENNQIKKYIINILALLGIFTLIYLISALFITKELDWFSKKEDTTSNNSVSNTILATEIFKQSENSYYVYFYDFDEEGKDSDITTLVNTNLSSDKVYKVNTKSALNINYVSDTSNKDAKTLDELKVINHTLIKITDDTITEYYENVTTFIVIGVIFIIIFVAVAIVAFVYLKKRLKYEEENEIG